LSETGKMKWFINYQENQSLSIFDRGLAYGDGVFETLSMRYGVIQSENFHRTRLKRALHRLFFVFSPQDLDHLFTFIMNHVDDTQLSQGAKIIITRGIGGRGYLPPQKTNLTIAIGFFSYQLDSKIQKKGVLLDQSTVPSTINRYTAGLKHLNRLENVLAKQALNQKSYEAFMLDDDGFLVECIQSNLFWFKGDILFTPLLNRSGVQGTLRSQIINEIHFFPVCIGQYKPEDIIDADEVFICNRLIGIVPVVEIDHLQKYSIGKNTRDLQKKLMITIT